jgi:hypothetical protein
LASVIERPTDSATDLVRALRIVWVSVFASVTSISWSSNALTERFDLFSASKKLEKGDSTGGKPWASFGTLFNAVDGALKMTPPGGLKTQLGHNIASSSLETNGRDICSSSTHPTQGEVSPHGTSPFSPPDLTGDLHK